MPFKAKLGAGLSKRGKHAILKRALGSLADTLSSSLSTTKAYEPKGPGQEAVRRFIALLEKACGEPRNLIVLIFDELFSPMLSWKAEQVAQVLDTLRNIRQVMPKVRMIFASSVGIGFVMRRMHHHDFSRSTLNDMERLHIPSLARKGAEELARRLLAGEGIEFEAVVPERIAGVTVGIPFHIHLLVSELANTKGRLKVQDVEEGVQRMTREHAKFPLVEHLDQRLRMTLDEEDYKITCRVFDSLAKSPEPLSESELQLKLLREFPDFEHVVEVLRVLQADN